MIEQRVGHQAAAGVDVRAAAAAAFAGRPALPALPPLSAGAAAFAAGGTAAAAAERHGAAAAAAGAGLFRGGDHAAVGAAHQTGTSEGAREDETRDEGAHQWSTEIIVENAQS